MSIKGHTGRPLEQTYANSLVRVSLTGRTPPDANDVLVNLSRLIDLVQAASFMRAIL